MFGLFKKKQNQTLLDYQKILDGGRIHFGPFSEFIEDFVNLNCRMCGSNIPSISLNNSIIFDEESLVFNLRCSSCRDVASTIDADYIVSRENRVSSFSQRYPVSIGIDRRMAAVVFAEKQILKYENKDLHGYPWINLVMFFRFFPKGFKENANYKNPLWDATVDKQGLEWVQYYHSYSNMEILDFCPECSNDLYLGENASDYAYENSDFRSVEWLLRNTERDGKEWEKMLKNITPVMDDDCDEFENIEHNLPSDLSLYRYEDFSDIEIKNKQREIIDKVIECVDQEVCFYCRLPWIERWNYKSTFKSDLECLHKYDAISDSKRKWHKEYLDYVDDLNSRVGDWLDYDSPLDDGEFGSFGLPDLLSMIDQPPYLE